MSPRQALHTWKLSTISVSPFSLLNFTAGVGVASVTLLGANLSSAIAQISTVTSPRIQGETTNVQMKTLFVNPNIGDDKNGNGSDCTDPNRTPCKTITRALQLAQPNTVIMLAPGEYSAKTGEIFPLILKSGVAIQGDIQTKGRNVNIIGGGEFLSRSFGGQNVTVVGANQASLSGVTIVNANPRGYGLWIESTNPVVQDNTFTGSTQDGIAVTGNATPSISRNYFFRNGANGMTISGTARPEVRENIFEQTGFGINIAQNAAPVIVANQIQQNRSGIIIQANARPLLRNNLIQGSKEDGLVVISQAVPDLGTAIDPGRNDFRSNGRYDINAQAAKELISAAGNNLARNRFVGRLDIQGTTAVARTIPSRNLPNQEIPTNNQGIVFAAPTQPSTSVQTQPQLLTRRNIPENNQLPSLPRTNLQANNQELQPQTNQLNYVQLESGAIEFTAPSASNPVVETAGNLEKLPTPRGFANTSQNARYRVVVLLANDQQRELIRSLSPDAFATIWQGRRVMQVGVFSSEGNAYEVANALISRGIRAIVEPLN
jgi:parallel beta-helix repeat protein